MSGKPKKVPALTIELGTVLEAVVLRGTVKTTVHEWRGMKLLAAHDAFDQRPASLYLVRAKPVKVDQVKQSQRKVERGAKSYERWHDREPVALYEIATREATHRQGRLVRLDYRSDKWHRRRHTIEYTHDFTERGGKGSLVTTDTRDLSKARTVVCSGGTVRVTERGIA
jgi:hypothetical protein